MALIGLLCAFLYRAKSKVSQETQLPWVMSFKVSCQAEMQASAQKMFWQQLAGYISRQSMAFCNVLLLLITNHKSLDLANWREILPKLLPDSLKAPVIWSTATCRPRRHRTQQTMQAESR